jgi:hypothetical protein
MLPFRPGVSLALLLLAATAEARGVSVHGHTNKRSGSYTSPHQRTPPNGSRSDNYGAKGNVNPQTGKRGTKDPFAPRRSRRSSAP